MRENLKGRQLVAWRCMCASGFFRGGGGGGTDLRLVREQPYIVWFITIIELTPQIHHITGPIYNIIN
jgi:hypothetical protein